MIAPRTVCKQKMEKRNENSLMTNNNDEEIGNNIFIPSF